MEDNNSLGERNKTMAKLSEKEKWMKRKEDGGRWKRKRKMEDKDILTKVESDGR